MLAPRADGAPALTTLMAVPMPTLIAFDTATERMSVALSHRGRVFARSGEGGAKASTHLLPAIFDTLAEAGIALAELDAIAFGRGPGAFTGLRTACSVAQGLAFGADKAVLPIDSLLAVAEDARVEVGLDGRIWAVIDARMDQVYAAEYEHSAGRWSTRASPCLTSCEALSARWRDDPPQAVAGNAVEVYGPRLDSAAAPRAPGATSNAAALLRLAGRAWREGEAVDPALALPVYLRDHVADTLVERQARRVAREAMATAKP
ncbi:MAG: tRNA (adenosine(37)-N6)-threonylcarbamoyltransferase complex dimerization subunit type 1 TsaB [Caldimonas sp.]